MINLIPFLGVLIKKGVVMGKCILFKKSATVLFIAILSVLLSFSLFPAKANSQEIIETYAGGGVCDGEPALNGCLNKPYGIGLGNSGNYYIADTYNHRVREVTGGYIYTTAGNGSQGFSGDGGPATDASLYYDTDVAVDSLGNIYIADILNHRIRKVDTGGIISTIAGTGVVGYSGDGGPATSAELNKPMFLTVDDYDNVYISEQLNNVIRKIDTSTGIISTVAGNGTAGFSGDGGLATSAQINQPFGLGFDSSGNLYFVDRANYRIRKVDTSGTITTVGGNGTRGYSGDGGMATGASIEVSTGLVIDSFDNIYFADSENHVIRMIDTSGIIYTVAGNGTAGFSGDGGSALTAQFNLPYDVELDDFGNILIVDRENQRIREYNPTTGTIDSIAGRGAEAATFSGDGLSATDAILNIPTSSVMDSSGNLYITDKNNQRIRKVDTSGIINTIAGNGTAGYTGDGGQALDATLNDPFFITIDSAGNLYFSGRLNHVIRKIDTSTGIISTVAGNGTAGFSGDGGTATSAQLNQPMGLGFDGAGNLYFVDRANYRIRKVDTSGTITTVAGDGTNGYSGDGGPAASAIISVSTGLAVDSSDNIYFADTNNNVVRMIDTSGIITTVAGNGTAGYSGDGGNALTAQLNAPYGVGVDDLDNLLITEKNNHTLREVDTTGIITTIAGSGTAGLSGDGGLPTDATMNFPVDVAFAGGSYYIADALNNRIRRAGPDNAPPVITSTPVTTATEGALYTYDVDATDANVGDVLTYYLNISPLGMTIDSSTGLISWTPNGSQVSPPDTPVTVMVDDNNGGSVTQSFAITVASLDSDGDGVPDGSDNCPGTPVGETVDANGCTVGTNTAPVADAGADQLVSVGYEVNLDGSGSSDADDDTLTYSWTLSVPSGSTTAVLSNPTAIYPTFIPDIGGTYVVQLIVNDGTVDSDPDTVSINVAAEFEVRISPQTINLDTNGNPVLVFVELPDEYPVTDVDPAKLSLFMVFYNCTSPPCTVDADLSTYNMKTSSNKFSIQFPREAVEALLEANNAWGQDITIRVQGGFYTGSTYENVTFFGDDIVTVNQ
jgi:hypothetical protein